MSNMPRSDYTDIPTLSQFLLVLSNDLDCLAVFKQLEKQNLFSTRKVDESEYEILL